MTWTTIARMEDDLETHIREAEGVDTRESHGK
jgi:hypothetical protein